MLKSSCCGVSRSLDLGSPEQGRKEELAAEARLLRDGAHRAALERAERMQRAAAQRAKFGALRCKHAAAADEDGKPRSQARSPLKDSGTEICKPDVARRAASTPPLPTASCARRRAACTDS